MPKEVEILFTFTEDQLTKVIISSVGIANELYEKGFSNKEVFRVVPEAQIRGLMIERELVNRRVLPKTESQVYSPPHDN